MLLVAITAPVHDRSTEAGSFRGMNAEHPKNTEGNPKRDLTVRAFLKPKTYSGFLSFEARHSSCVTGNTALANARNRRR